MVFYNVLDCRNHIRDIGIRQTGVQWQGNQALEFAISYRKIIGLPAVFVTIVTVQVNRDEVHAGADVASLHFVDELTAIKAQPVKVEPQHVQIPG